MSGVKKPPNIVFGLEDAPPLAVTILNGLQHVGVIAINLVYPLLVLRVAEATPPVAIALLAASMFMVGVGTFLQTLRLGPIGSGYMCPATVTATYIGPSLLAAKLGGLPLVFGMTVFAGLLEVALAPLLNRMRPIFPPEISGLVIFMIGWSASITGLRLMLGEHGGPVATAEWWVAGITLVTMVAFNVWGKGLARMLCALIGLVVGYAVAALAGLFDTEKDFPMSDAAWLGLPSLAHLSWTFDAALAVPFLIATLAAAMKAVATITVCQRTTDADWVRPDMRSATRGVLADGVSTALAGLAGGFGTNTATPSVGLASVTGVVSRHVAFAVGAMFVVLAFFPKLSALLAMMPRSVMMAGLLFAMSAVTINGIQIISSRLLDARRTLVIALSMVVGTAVDIFPAIATAAPKGFAPILGSSLVLATVTALALNLLFRLGVKKKVTLTVEGGTVDAQKIEDFMKAQGAAWGARPDVIQRAAFGVIQLAEAVAEHCEPQGPITIEASFDEFNLDLRVRYAGQPLELPETRPSEHDIRETEDGVRWLAGFMLRRNADRVRSSMHNGRVTVHFHFDH